MKRYRTYRVKDVARLSGVSVRTLHHYDEIGLLAPVSRTASGYRLYDNDSLLRLQQILINRALGLSLEAIRRLLDDPGYDCKAALVAQREQLEAKAQETREMIAGIDRALFAIAQQERMDKMDMKEIFEGFDPSRYEQEAKERWGDTDAYKESTLRARNYTTSDWAVVKAEQDGVYRAAAEAMAAGKSPSDESVMDIAEQHRLIIDRWFYPCSLHMHCGLADMYEADQRFAESIDGYAAGLTPFLVQAIRANARRG
jgi:DNA-binding transcriptional MerR regulator